MEITCYRTKKAPRDQEPSLFYNANYVQQDPSVVPCCLAIANRCSGIIDAQCRNQRCHHSAFPSQSRRSTHSLLLQLYLNSLPGFLAQTGTVLGALAHSQKDEESRYQKGEIAIANVSYLAQSTSVLTWCNA